jgi:hypothetical protein
LINTDEQGKEFQDYISFLTQIPFYSSKKYQLEKGESPAFILPEVKYDNEAHNIGHWVELAEKRNAQNNSWIWTDWFINPKPIFVVAGNQKKWWIFTRRDLFRVYDYYKSQIRIISKGTSLGFCIPSIECCQWASGEWEENKQKGLPLLENKKEQIIKEIKEKFCSYEFKSLFEK